LSTPDVLTHSIGHSIRLCSERADMDRRTTIEKYPVIVIHAGLPVVADHFFLFSL
jgi:hypothetical protein